MPADLHDARHRCQRLAIGDQHPSLSEAHTHSHTRNAFPAIPTLRLAAERPLKLTDLATQLPITGALLLALLSLNPVSLSIERPMPSPTPDSSSGGYAPSEPARPKSATRQHGNGERSTWRCLRRKASD